MKRLPLLLIIALPALSVIMGLVTLYVAFSGPQQELSIDRPPLDKTSWQTEGDTP